jgi:hypothetical protein
MQTDERPRAREMLGSASNLSSFLARPENVRQAYAALTVRKKEIGRLLDAVQQNRRMPALDPVDRLLAIASIEPVLEDVPDYAIAECFKRALKDHHCDGPFQIGEVVKAWREMTEGTRTALYEAYAKHPSLPAGPPCEWCDDRGWKRVNNAEVDVKWNSPEETSRVARCHCGAGAVRKRNPAANFEISRSDEIAPTVKTMIAELRKGMSRSGSRAA